jgi:AcrR family transcriptional regulator
MTHLDSTADRRREAVINAAARLLAQHGLMGTPTTAVADAVGISQPYVFRLFGSKLELTVAVINHCHQQVHQRLRRRQLAPEPEARTSSTRHEAPPGLPELHLPYRRAALAFMDWQLRRGLLNAVDGESPGSPWWRAVNERLLRDTAESRALVLGRGGPTSSPSVAHSVAFVRRPSAHAWYRAHNATIVSAYLDHRELAEDESHVERFFINLGCWSGCSTRTPWWPPRAWPSAGWRHSPASWAIHASGWPACSYPCRGFSPTGTPWAATSGRTWTPSTASVDFSTSA